MFSIISEKCDAHFIKIEFNGISDASTFIIENKNYDELLTFLFAGSLIKYIHYLNVKVQIN